MSKYEIKFEKCSEAWGVINKMKDIINEYGQVSVADQKELCGQKSTYTDNNYGWKELKNKFIVYDAASRNYVLHLNQPEPLDKGCTYDRCTENRYGYTCPHCQSLNLREISGYHEEGAPYGTIGYECTDCHTTFTVDVFDEAALKQENERLKQELEETKRELENTKNRLKFYKDLKNQLNSDLHICQAELMHSGSTIADLRTYKKETQKAVKDLSCLCTILDSWGECFAHSYVTHFPNRVTKDTLIEIVMRYSKNK